MLTLPKEHAVTSETARASYERNCQYAESDLQRSGLVLQDIHALINPYPVGVSAFVADSIPQSYVIPYWWRDGTPIVDELGFPKMYRVRQNVADKRYSQPSKEQIGELSLFPYFHPEREAHVTEPFRKVYAIVEGEKKYVKLWKETGIRGCAIGGCWNWKSGEIDVHPEIIADIKDSGATEILIAADGDWRRYRILTAYGGLVSGLRRVFGDSISCRILDLSRTQQKGIDDYFVAGLPFEEIPLVDIGTEVVEHPRILISQYGLIPKETKSSIKVYPCEANYISLLQQHPTFSDEDLWYNEDTMSVMWNGGELKDSDVTTLTAHFQKYLSIPEAGIGQIRNSVVTVAEKRTKSPIREWLKSLVWDGVDRLDEMFVRYCSAEDSPYVRETSRRLMLGSVARAMEPGCKFDQLTILQGKQGVGKTQFWWTLYGAGNVTDVHGMGSDKDFMMQINLRWCTNFEELDAYDRRDATQLKAIITSQEDIFRPPYGHAPTKHKRKTVMVGNTNKVGFLKEDVNRREFPLTVGKVNIALLKEERDQLWAEAVHRYGAGEPWWDTKGEDYKWERYKQGFKRDNPYEEALEEILMRMDFSHHYKDMPVLKGLTIVRALESVVGKVNNTIFGDAMERLGWVKQQMKGGMLTPKVLAKTQEFDSFSPDNQRVWVWERQPK